MVCIMSEQFIIQPTPKQQLFLESEADILMFGGQVAGGKSWSLLLDCLGLNDPINGPRIKLSYYRALVIRKQYSHLIDLIDKSKQIFPKIDSGAIFNNSEMFWTFSSGAIVRFVYIDTILDTEKIIGAEAAWIGFDEISLYPNDKVFRFAMSRLRSANGLKCYMRCTANPSRFPWLKNMFRINDVGDSTDFFVETPTSNGNTIKKHIQYIQAKLSDNPHISSEYAAGLYLLSEEDRKALLDGMWNSYSLIEGSIYKQELEILYKENRYCRVPLQKEFDIYAAFDLGKRDSTAVTIFQKCGLEYHVIDYFEDTFKDITFYIAWLKNNENPEYKNAHIILPHDSKQQHIEAKETTYEIVKKAFGNVTVLPRANSVETDIDCVRRKFKHIFIDKKLTRLTECLTNYKRKKNEILNVYEGIIHDEFSNGADSFRYMCVFEKEEPVVLEMGYYAPFSGI